MDKKEMNGGKIYVAFCGKSLCLQFNLPIWRAKRFLSTHVGMLKAGANLEKEKKPPAAGSRKDFFSFPFST